MLPCRLVCAPAIRADCRSALTGDAPGAKLGDAAAAVAAEQAGQSLFERLLAVLAALLSGTWASWLHGDQVTFHCPDPVSCSCADPTLQMCPTAGSLAVVWSPVQLEPSRSTLWSASQEEFSSVPALERFCRHLLDHRLMQSRMQQQCESGPKQGPDLELSNMRPCHPYTLFLQLSSCDADLTLSSHVRHARRGTSCGRCRRTPTCARSPWSSGQRGFRSGSAWRPCQCCRVCRHRASSRRPPLPLS